MARCRERLGVRALMAADAVGPCPRRTAVREIVAVETGQIVRCCKREGILGMTAGERWDPASHIMAVPAECLIGSRRCELRPESQAYTQTRGKRGSHPR